MIYCNLHFTKKKKKSTLKKFKNFLSLRPSAAVQ